MALAQIPVIDISSCIQEIQIAKKLTVAASTYGFVYIKGFQDFISTESTNKIFSIAKNFFDSSLAEKVSCQIQENNRGWIATNSESLDPSKGKIGDFKEALNIGQFHEGRAQQLLPKALIEYESTIDQFQRNCHALMLRLLVLFAKGLDIDEEAGGVNWFVSRHHNSESNESILRLLHYPPFPPEYKLKSHDDIRAGAHTDYGSLTLLFQKSSQPGLEILLPSRPEFEKSSSVTESWEPVPVFPPGTEGDPNPPILVNIGDLLSFWTNGFLKSTIHRVVIPQTGDSYSGSRYSIAYFGHPVGSTILEPIPSPIIRSLVRSSLDEVEALTAHEHLRNRLKVTHSGICPNDTNLGDQNSTSL